MEARAALSRSGMISLPSNQNPVKMDVIPPGPALPISAPPLAVPSGGFACLPEFSAYFFLVLWFFRIT